jgi:hypothetical protein
VIVIGFGHPLANGVALAALLLLGGMLVSPGLVRRHYALASISERVILTVLMAVALIDIPAYATLILGLYGVMIVASGHFVMFDQRPHLAWLVAALAVLAVALGLAPIGGSTRVEGLAIGLGAVAASAGGHWMAQTRRERAYMAEDLLRSQRSELRDTVGRLEKARETIATLEGILCICAHCKRIRDTGDEWVRVESFVEQRSGAQFSHGICPDCAARYYADILEEPDRDVVSRP